MDTPSGRYPRLGWLPIADETAITAPLSSIPWTLCEQVRFRLIPAFPLWYSYHYDKRNIPLSFCASAPLR